LFVIAGWHAALAGDGARPSPRPCAFVHANVIPMNEERLLSDQTVVVENGLITQVGPSKTVPIPHGACRIEATGKFLLPGLADAHVHLLSPNELPLYLANGVTTVFNLDYRAHL
jgi:imidazolonepropionase-like amidohydrolase